MGLLVMMPIGRIFHLAEVLILEIKMKNMMIMRRRMMKMMIMRKEGEIQNQRQMICSAT